jgi:F-box interacting protein
LEEPRTAPPPPCHQHVPDELIEDILARMPAKSVLRCRRLSRAWAALLSSDAFVDKHLDLANRRHRGALPRLCLLPGSTAASTVYAWSPPAPEHGEKQGSFVPLMRVPHNTRNGALAAVTRPCRGLLLLRSVDAKLYYLCNPSAGQIAALPDGRMAGARCPSRDYASFGLGYDARTRTHKVVRLLYHESLPAGCDVYDVGGGAGHWRAAASGAVPPERVRMNQMGVFVHGHVHWVTLTYISDSDDDAAIFSFSMATEEFGQIAAPPPVKIEFDTRLTELAGCLCLVSAPRSPQWQLSIWLLTDYAAGSWEKHCHIDLTKLPPAPAPDLMFNCVTPLALVDGGRGVIFMSDDYQVATYSLATGTLEEAVVPGLRGIGIVRGGASLPLLTPYEESLATAGRPFEDILFSPPAVRALSMVLRRLPARALGRLKLVCKGWRAMIESDHFAASHNDNAAAAAASKLPISVVFVDPFGSTDRPVAAELSELVTSAVVPLASSCLGGDDPGQNQNPPLSTSRVVCRRTCHGLLLLSNQHSEVYALCNPVTRHVRTFVFSGEGHGCAGLGYDQYKEEHVLVRLSYREDVMECQVWPLRDLHPRTLASEPPIPAAVDVPPVHVGGKMYWPGEPRLSDAAAILALDISTETFEAVPAPPVMVDADGGDRMILSELDGKLCAAHTSRRTETVTIWSRNDDGEWMTKHETMQLEQWPEFSPRSAELVVPLAVDPVDRRRVLLDTGKVLGYYDASTGSLEMVYSLRSKLISLLGEHHRADDHLFFIAAVCEDSLFRPYDRIPRIW